MKDCKGIKKEQPASQQLHCCVHPKHFLPAADEDERETKIKDVEVWEFNEEKDNFSRTKEVTNQQQLNNRFDLSLEEFGN